VQLYNRGFNRLGLADDASLRYVHTDALNGMLATVVSKSTYYVLNRAVPSK